MTTKIEKTVQVDQPVSTVYNQWTQFEEFPHFMGGVQKVDQLDNERLHWVAEIAGVKREWDAKILEQVPDEKIAWAATEGATNAGAVYFTALGASRTSVKLVLEYEPKGIVEKAGDALNIVERRAEADLEKFKSFIEDAGYASGAWRGAIDKGFDVGTPGVEDAAQTRDDSGKAGLSGKAITFAVGAAVAGAVMANKKKDSPEQSETEFEVVEPTYIPPTAYDVPEVAAPYPTDGVQDETYALEDTTRKNRIK